MSTQYHAPLILHAIVIEKAYVLTRSGAVKYVLTHFPRAYVKDVREGLKTFRVRVYPSIVFDNTAYVSKKINDHLTLVFGRRASA